MIAFDAAHQAVHYPEDRRFRIWVRPSILVGAGAVVLPLIAAAWIEFAVSGLRPLRDALKRGPVTLVSSAHDEAHSQAVVLREYLLEARRSIRKARSTGRRRSVNRSASGIL